MLSCCKDIYLETAVTRARRATTAAVTQCHLPPALIALTPHTSSFLLAVPRSCPQQSPSISRDALLGSILSEPGASCAISELIRKVSEPTELSLCPAEASTNTAFPHSLLAMKSNLPVWNSSTQGVSLLLEALIAIWRSSSAKACIVQQKGTVIWPQLGQVAPDPMSACTPGAAAPCSHTVCSDAG